jgi:hypothetical protein
MVSSVKEKTRSLNKEIKILNNAIAEAKRDIARTNAGPFDDSKAFSANLERRKAEQQAHSDAAASVEQADDQSFNLDSLFASSIMGSRNIK